MQKTPLLRFPVIGEAGGGFFLVFSFSLLVLVAAALVFRDPGFIDAYYYYHVAHNLAAGRGFTEDVIWSYVAPPAALTHPSNLYWMPLVSVVTAPFLHLIDAGWRAAQLPLLVIAATLPALTGIFAHKVTRSWFKALAAAWLVLFSGYYFVYWTAVDGFALYCLAAGASFIATARLTQGRGRAWSYSLLLGVACAAGHLARADGVLLLATNLAVVAYGRRELKAAGIAMAAYLVCMAPWFLRNFLAVGAPLPSGGLQTIFLREYNEIFAYGLELNAAYYFGQEFGDLVGGKAAAALRNLGVLFGLQYWLVPLALVGWRAALRDERRHLFLPPLVYGITLYLSMTFLFTFPSGRGTMLHSSVALLPWLAVAAVEGIDRTVLWTARRRAHWRPEIAFRNFTLIFLGFSLVVSLYALVDQSRGWSRQVDVYREIAPTVFADEPEAVALVLNAPGWWYVTGRPALQTPSNGPDAAVAVAARYGGTHLVLEPANLPAWHGFEEAGDPRFRLIAEARGYRVYRVVQGTSD